MQVDVYKILCFSEMSLPRADILPDLIFKTLPHECSVDPIPGNSEVNLQATKPSTLVDGKEYL